MSRDILELQEVPIARFSNFSAGPTKYNPQGGVITFNPIIEDLDYGEQLLADGWNMKTLTDDEGDLSAYHLSVKINFKSPYPPRVYRISDRSRTKIAMRADTIHVLDSMRIIFADLSINKYEWSVGDNSGVKAYLETGYFLVQETDLDRKWERMFEGDAEEIEANFEALIKGKMSE